MNNIFRVFFDSIRLAKEALSSEDSSRTELLCIVVPTIIYSLIDLVRAFPTISKPGQPWLLSTIASLLCSLFIVGFIIRLHSRKNGLTDIIKTYYIVLIGAGVIKGIIGILISLFVPYFLGVERSIELKYYEWNSIVTSIIGCIYVTYGLHYCYRDDS